MGGSDKRIAKEQKQREHARRPVRTVRGLDIAVIVTIALALIGAVYKFAKLEGRVGELKFGDIKAAIELGIREIEAKSDSVARMPVGAILPFAGTKDLVPAGWLLCDGEPLRTGRQYDELRTILAAGSWKRNASIILLPDLRGRFLRGLDRPKGGTAAELDPEWQTRAVGSPQGDTRGSHQHGSEDMIAQITASRGEVPLNLRGAPAWGAAKCLKGIKAAGPDAGNETQVTGVAITGITSPEFAFVDEENRPENCAVNYIIKF